MSASHAPARLPSGAAHSGWCAVSSRSPAMDAGTAGHRDSSEVRSSAPPPGSPQNAASAAPASRDGNSPHLAAAKLTDEASPPPPPSVTKSAGKPPGVSAAAIQCRSASRSAAGSSPFSIDETTARLAATRAALAGCSINNPTARWASTLDSALVKCAPWWRSSAARHSARTSESSAPSLAVAFGSKYDASGLIASVHTPSFVASLAASSSTADAVETMNSDIAPSARCDGFAAPALAAAATALTSDPAPPANFGFAAIAPTRTRRQRLPWPSLPSLIPPSSAAATSTGRVSGRCVSHAPSASVIRSLTSRCASHPSELASAAHASRAINPTNESSEPSPPSSSFESPPSRRSLAMAPIAAKSPARACHSFGRLFGSPSSATMASKYLRAATAAPASATAATHATAVHLRRVSTCLTCASTQSLIASSPAWASRLARGAWASMEATDARTASGDRRSCLQLCATAPSANSAGFIVATSRWNKGLSRAGGGLALASPPRTTRVYASIARDLTSATTSGDEHAVVVE
mmetsp:Transcript_733/g.2819  ORF Transcript_733/g.2819 Transcript_733/m.2819 type:complete len:525 (-) Transcript_733:620-2194(-)